MVKVLSAILNKFNNQSEMVKVLSVILNKFNNYNSEIVKNIHYNFKQNQ